MLQLSDLHVISCRPSSNQDSCSCSSKQQVPLSRHWAASPVGSAAGLWSLLTFRLLSLLRIIAVSTRPQLPRRHSKLERKCIQMICGCYLALLDAAAVSKTAVRKAPLQSNLHREPGSGAGLQGSRVLELLRWSRDLSTKLPMNRCTMLASSAGQSRESVSLLGHFVCPE